MQEGEIMENSYKEKIIEKYAGGGEVHRAEQTGQFAMEFIYTKRALDNYIAPEKKVIELGCGGGYYLMNYAPKCKEYRGVDLSPVNVEIVEKQIADSGYTNASVIRGDATDLKEIEAESYDVVLCLGPLYHLKREDRILCIRECRRICKQGGIIVFAFINKIGAIAKFGHGVGWKNVLTPAVGECVMERGTDDVHTDIFFFTMPEEMIEDTESVGLKRIKMTGVDFLLLEPEIEGFTEEQRSIWFKFADMVADSEYATSLSNHALFICQKQEAEL